MPSWYAGVPKIFLKKLIGIKKTNNSLLTSNLLTKSPRKACKKSSLQNSQLKVPFLILLVHCFSFFVFGFFLVISLAIS